jgi:phosphatidylglycerol phospholipase C
MYEPPYPLFTTSPPNPPKQENYIHHSRLHLPGHALAYIGFSLLYARRFLSDKHADVHFNLFQPSLVGPLGARFRRAARERGRKLFVWTVNEEGWMEWAVRKGVDGVITDEVGRMSGVLDRLGAAGGDVAPGGTKWRPRAVGLYARAVVWQAAALLFSLLLWRRLSTLGSRRKPSGVTVPGKR